MSVPRSEWPPAERSAEWTVRDHDLFEAIEWHLLKAQLTPAQVRCVERHGWFDVVWRAQCLVLRIYADRFPTVDAFQLNRQASYLCSFNMRDAVCTDDRRRQRPDVTRSPVAIARSVLEAHRRGMLKALLESGVQISEHR